MYRFLELSLFYSQVDVWNNICVCWHGCFTVVALQSLNLSLQTQLNESRRERDDLQQENMRLQKAMEDITS